MELPDCTRKLTIIANSVHGEREMMWAMRATDLILALWDIKESFVRLRNDSVADLDVEIGRRGYEVVSEVLESYSLKDLLSTVG
jgi:uncharacterized protein YqjF (DUF2071 family)